MKMSMKTNWMLRAFFLVALVAGAVSFQPAASQRGHAGRTALKSATTTSSTSSITVEVVQGGEEDPRVLDVASFRNGIKNPEMMVARAKEKRDAIDTTSAALDGLKIGLLYVGPVIGGFTYLETNNLPDALQNYAVLGGGLGVLLAANNYMGRGIHVPDIPEATK